MILVWCLAIELLIQLDNVRVGSVPRILVTCTVEAQDKLRLLLLLLVWHVCLDGMDFIHPIDFWGRSSWHR